MKQVLKSFVLLALITLGTHVMFADNIVLNGTFSNSPGGAYTTVYAGQNTISKWTVDSGSVDWINSYWQTPPAGGGSIDLDGNSPGSISQTLATVKNQIYQVSFYLSGNRTAVQ